MKNLQKLFVVLVMGLALLVTGCASDEAADNQAEETGTEETAAQNTDANATESAAAEEAPALESWVSDPDVVKISVPDAQCDACVKTICGAVQKVNHAKACDFDLTTNTAFVKVSEHSPQIEMELEAAIAGSGYSTKNMAHNEDAFNALPDCCKPGGMDDHSKSKSTEM